MRSTKQLSITLPLEMADMVRAKVTSGEYASESEVIRDGLRALGEREAAVDRWLRDEVTAIYEAWKANPEDVQDMDEVFDEIDAELAARERQAG